MDSTLKEAGEAILKWFAGLSGQALDAAILKSFHQFDLDGTGLLDRHAFSPPLSLRGYGALRLLGADGSV